MATPCCKWLPGDVTRLGEIETVEPIKIGFASQLVGALAENDEKSVFARQIRRDNYENVKIVANLDQVTWVSYPRQEDQHEHKQKLNGFLYSTQLLDYRRSVRTVALWTFLESFNLVLCNPSQAS